MKNYLIDQPDEAMLELIKQSGSNRKEVAHAAQTELAIALTLPLRQGVMNGDNLNSIFSRVSTNGRSSYEYPVDLLAPGTEDEYTAFTHTGTGRIYEKLVEGDYVMVPTYPIANSIDWALRMARDANYPVVARCLQILEAGMTQKVNDDGWHTLITAAADRNVLVFDSDATAGTFTKRVVSLMKTQMARGGGGNMSSLRKSRLTDLYVSLENIEDIRNWGLDQVDEVTRNQIYNAADGTINRIFSVNLHPMYELGEGQPYQLFYSNTLSGTLPTGDLEIMVGLDQSTSDSFISPVVQDMEVNFDDQMHRRGKAGYYATLETGFACLDQRRVLIGSV
jgi:hypothetical protein